MNPQYKCHVPILYAKIIVRDQNLLRKKDKEHELATDALRRLKNRKFINVGNDFRTFGSSKYTRIGPKLTLMTFSAPQAGEN